VRRLGAGEGVGVLRGTNLIDEVHVDDQVIVLHVGRMRALGDGVAIGGKAEARDLRHAFTKLTTEARAA
jgi:ABC-2 type transport system ATP-binding protein